MRAALDLVLGFIGLPTIGFHLESYFKQGTTRRPRRC
jgi:hypothetical protein